MAAKGRHPAAGRGAGGGAGGGAVSGGRSGQRERGGGAGLGARDGRRRGAGGGVSGAGVSAGDRGNSLGAAAMGLAWHRRGTDGNRRGYPAAARSALGLERLWLQPSAAALGGDVRVFHGVIVVRARVPGCGRGQAEDDGGAAGRRSPGGRGGEPAGGARRDCQGLWAGCGNGDRAGGIRHRYGIAGFGADASGGTGGADPQHPDRAGGNRPRRADGGPRGAFFREYRAGRGCGV